MHAPSELLRHLYSAVLSDVMDEMGLSRQALYPFRAVGSISR